MVNFSHDKIGLEHKGAPGYSDSPLRSHEIFQTLDAHYTPEEFNEKRGKVAGASYLLRYKPEICQHKTILERIRKTGRLSSMTLEGEGSQGYVVQISDICIKFKNQNITSNFKKEIENYAFIEKLYKECFAGGNAYFKIPELQRLLSDKSFLAMEYVPGFTLAALATYRDSSFKEKDLVSVLQSHDEDDLQEIKKRLGYNYTHLLQQLKDHELRTILIYMGVDEEQFANFSALDPLFLIEYSGGSEQKAMVDAYRKRQQALRQHHVLSIDDHGENLKLYNTTLYALDFGNITFSSKSGKLGTK